MKQKVAESIVKWGNTLDRDLPWKAFNDPYTIWLSEVILQQTRVETGRTYFVSFKKAFPTIKDLAAAELSEVIQLWQGLGYYSRARNMHLTARLIVEKHDGVFPSSYDELIALKGIGPYTAAALSSFAFDNPKAVVDGNVYRVLSRLFGEFEPIYTSKGKKRFQHLADSILPIEKHAEFNQAIMNFGALICKPKSPLCDQCQISEHCYAFAYGVQQELPIRKKAGPVKVRYFVFFLIRHSGHLIVEERLGKDIWQNLYQLPMVELSELDNNFDYNRHLEQQAGKKEYTLAAVHSKLEQRLSHQLIKAEIVEIHCDELITNENQKIIAEEQVNTLPFPRLLQRFLKSFLS